MTKLKEKKIEIKILLMKQITRFEDIFTVSFSLFSLLENLEKLKNYFVRVKEFLCCGSLLDILDFCGYFCTTRFDLDSV